MKKDLTAKFDKEKIKSYLRFAGTTIVVILFFNFIFWPQNQKLNELIYKVKEKTLLFSRIEKNVNNIGALRKEIDSLEKRVAQLEEKLPEQIEANLLIETLKDITEEANIKFVSIEPKNTKKFELAGQKQVYLELPITVKLKCGYEELLSFVKNIENSKRLMKVSDLSIKTNPQSTWEHAAEITISTFSSLKQ